MRVLPKISETRDDVTGRCETEVRVIQVVGLLFFIAIPFNINLQEDFPIISDFFGGRCFGTIDIWKVSEGYGKKSRFY